MVGRPNAKHSLVPDVVAAALRGFHSQLYVSQTTGHWRRISARRPAWVHWSRSIFLTSPRNVGTTLVLVCPLSLVVLAFAEERAGDSHRLRNGIVGAVRWASDGKNGAALRRARYERFADLPGTVDSAACVAHVGGSTPSSIRRVGSWAADMTVLLFARTVVAYAATAIAPVLVPVLGPFAGVAAWSTRDQWLEIGRASCRERV